ncbi:cytochrome P450 [Mucidula mucida]|nr:cytochrome P450 [Mucidula mucida]
MTCQQAWYFQSSGLWINLSLHVTQRCPDERSGAFCTCSSFPAMAFLLFSLSVLILTTYIIKTYRRKSSSIRLIQGPPNPSWLLGNQRVGLDRHTASNLGDYRSWYDKYGPVYRVAGVFSESILVLADPKAIQYVLHTSGYRSPKTGDSDHLADLVFGPGIVSAAGKQHQRQRRVLNGAFSATQIRSYLKVSQTLSARLVEKLSESLNGRPRVCNIAHWVRNVALDIIGITSFRYHFDAIEGKENEIAKRMESILPDSPLSLSAFQLVLSQGLLRHLPKFLVSLMTKLPFEDVIKFREFRHVVDATARDLHERQVQAIKEVGVGDEKDIINLLAISSLSDDETMHMKEDEIISQMVTFIFAGHDTTAAAVGWLLYELSAHPSDQVNIREEILRTSALSLGDYNSMPLLNAAIKVLFYSPLLPRLQYSSPACQKSLRRNSFVHTLRRVAAQDDVIPLSHPITTREGKFAERVGRRRRQVEPGTILNRSEEDVTVGVYANLCRSSSMYGWRFAIMEIQSIVVELLSSFEFSLPKETPPLVHGSGLQTTFPLVKGKEMEGMQIPLCVSPFGSK